MPHFRIDDALHSHPKAQRAGDEAMGMWTRAGSYCMAYLTDGFVPDWWVKQQPKGVAKAKKLVECGLWHDGAERDGETGYIFHEFVGPGRQDSREKVEADREFARKRKQKSRQSSQEESHRDDHRDEPSDTHRDYHRESQRSPTRDARVTQPNPTHKENSSSHLRDDDHVSNARTDELDPPPEPPYDPDAEPPYDVVNIDNPPAFVDNPSRPSVRQPTSGAKTVVRQVLGAHGLAAYPRTFLNRLAIQVDDLTREGHPDELIRRTLTEWDQRENVRPEWLANVYGDIVKNTRATPGNNGKPVHKMRAYAELAAQVRAEEQLAAAKELES